MDHPLESTEDEGDACGGVKKLLKKSALSHAVKKLICETGTGIPSNQVNTQLSTNSEVIEGNGSTNPMSIFFKDHTLRIGGFFEHCFDQGTIKELPWTSEDYEKAVAHCSPIFKESQSLLESKQLGEFSDCYDEFFQWTKNVKLFLDAFQLLTSNREDKDLLALLLICGGIEHALGNVFLLKEQQCPSLLKDLLSTEELREILGHEAIKILHLLIGPPISMNLRNVAWHGFFSVGELPKRYAYFLLVFIASMCQSLSSKGIQSSDITNRPYYSLSKADVIAEKLPVLNDHYLEKIEQGILTSWFTDESNQGFIHGIFDFYREGKYGFSCALALPVLEHILRRLFVSVNNCPERLKTAEATTLYTTFEEIFHYGLPDGKENSVIHILGEPFLDLLHDLFVYPNGPRARDKLGHGEADYYSVPPSLMSVVFTSMAFIAVKACSTEIDDPILLDLKTHVDNYESLFHPLTMLKGKIIQLAQAASSIHKSLSTSPDLSPWNADLGYDGFTGKTSSLQAIQHDMLTFLDNIHRSGHPSLVFEVDELKHRMMEPFTTIGDFVDGYFDKRRISTLHRWQRTTKPSTLSITESEIVSLLLRTVSEAGTSLNQSKESLLLRQQQLCEKTLRSRQRENLKKLIAFLPSLDLMMKYIIVLSLRVFNNLENSTLYDSTLQDSKSLKLMQRFLKSSLQAFENLRTFTASDANKWTQSEEIVIKALKSGVDFTGKLTSDS